MTDIPCLVCVSGDVARLGVTKGHQITPDGIFLNALVWVEDLGYEDVRRSLCPKHLDQLRQLLRASSRARAQQLVRR